MIEYCTKKVMVIAITGSILISVLVLFFEDSLSQSPTPVAYRNANTSKFIKENCIHNEKYEIITPCLRCTDFEMTSRHPGCHMTGYKQHVHCAVTKDVWVYCSLGDTKDERRHFLMFEGVTALLGIASYVVVYKRQKRLDRLLMEKVNRQIGAGV